MRASGSRIRRMGMECISIWMERDMKGNGLMMLNMALEPSTGLMEPNTRANIIKGRRRVKEYLTGATVPAMKANL